MSDRLRTLVKSSLMHIDISNLGLDITALTECASLHLLLFLPQILVSRLHVSAPLIFLYLTEELLGHVLASEQ